MKPETLMKIKFEVSQIDNLLNETAPLLDLVHSNNHRSDDPEIFV